MKLLNKLDELADYLQEDVERDVRNYLKKLTAKFKKKFTNLLETKKEANSTQPILTAKHEKGWDEEYKKLEKYFPGFIKIAPYDETYIQESNPHFRYTMDYLRVIIDPHNEHYLKFLETCKIAQKNLRTELQKTLEEKYPEYKIWVGNNRMPKRKKDYRRISFFIAPPFLSSTYLSQGKNNNITIGKNELFYAFHIYPDGFIQVMRQSAKGGQLGYSIAEGLNEAKENLENIGGDWEKMSEILANIIIQSVDTEAKNALSP